MINKSLALILLNLALLLFNLLLFLNLAHVVLTLNTSLLSQVDLLLLELSLSSLLKICSDSLSLLMLELFSKTCLSFTFFECTLSSQSINFSLSIGGFLLKLSELLDLTLFLILESLSLKLSFMLLLVLGLLVCNDLHLLVLLLLCTLLFFNKSLSVGLSSLFHKDVHSLLLSNGSGLIFFPHSFDIVEELDSLFVSQFLLLESNLSTLLDLVNDDLGTLLPGMMLFDFSLFFGLENFQTLNLHHEIKLFLLLDMFFLELNVLFDLLVSNGHNLGV